MSDLGATKELSGALLQRAPGAKVGAVADEVMSGLAQNSTVYSCLSYCSFHAGFLYFRTPIMH